MKKAFLSGVLPLLFLAAIHTGAYAEFYNRAPDVLPGLQKEMYTPAFWIAKMKDPDAVILTPAQIRAKNDAYRKLAGSPDPFAGAEADRKPNLDDLNRWPGRYVSLPDISAMSSSELALLIGAEIDKDIAFMRGKYSRNMLGLRVEFKEFGNALGIKYTDWELDRFEKEMARDLIAMKPEPREGITVCDARLRIVPSMTPEQVGLMENGKARWDVWNVNIVRIGSPVTVLHASRSGGYVYVLSGEGFGWIRSEEAAFAPKAEITRFSAPSDFVVSSGDRVPYFSDESCRYASGWMRMGDRLPLASKANPRLILAPVRRTNGQFATEQAWLAKDADIHVGWLPYTRRNVATTAFKMMGNPYDWSMAWYGRNHETTLRDLFACFGFELPFNAELFTFYSDVNPRVIRPSEGKEAQYRAILANEPCITIQTCGGGHSQLFIGEHNGEPFVLDTHGYGYDQDGVRYEIRRLTVGNMTQPEYFLKTNFTFCVLK